MKMIFAATAVSLAAVLAAGTVNAAGLNDRDDRLPPVADDGENWTGFWAGIAAGAQTGNTELEAGPFEFDGLGSDGVTGCLRAGYDHQTGRFVIGAWGEGCLSTAESSLEIGPAEISVEEDWSAGAGLRAGVAAWSHTAVFARGGYRWSKVGFDGPAGFDDMDDETFGGWMLGGEVETYMSDTMTVGLTVDHTWFGDEEFGDVTASRNETRGLMSVGVRF